MAAAAGQKQHPENCESLPGDSTPEPLPGNLGKKRRSGRKRTLTGDPALYFGGDWACSI